MNQINVTPNEPGTDPGKSAAWNNLTWAVAAVLVIAAVAIAVVYVASHVG